MAIHTHKCQDFTCNTVWSHDGVETRHVGEEKGVEAYEALHKCPTCGKLQRWVYCREDSTLPPEQQEALHRALNRIAPGEDDPDNLGQMLAIALIFAKYRD